MKKYLIVILLVTNTLLAFAQQEPPQYSFDKGICYRTDDDYCSQMCLMDIAYRKGESDLPVIVHFHGGSLRSGKRSIPSCMLRVVGHKDVTLYEFDGFGHNMQEPGYPMLLKFIKEHINKQNN